MFTNTQLPLFGAPDAPGLIELVENGRIVVPRFQRPWQWTHARTLALIRSIARQWPAGALLLMQGTRGFPSLPLHLVDAPAADPVYSILDGQQRLTALYLTLRGRHPRHTFFVNVGKVAAEREATEDDFGYWTNRQWNDTYPTTAQRAQAGMIGVHELRSDNLFFEWIAALPAGIPPEPIFEARNSTLAGLLNYQFPVSVVSAEAPVEVLTSVFVTINQQGLRLGVFDLMVAKSWVDPAVAAPGFDLRDQWDRAIAAGRHEHAPATHPKIRDFDLSGVVVLRLIKLLADPAAGNVANAGIMELSGPDVRTHLHPALDALEQTLTFVEADAGAIPEALPSQTGVLPMAYVLARSPEALSDANRHAKLLRWFWSSTFLQRYGRGGTNTLVVADVTEIEGWILGEEPEPAWIANFWSDFTEASLLETETTNEVLLRGIFCLQNLTGAVDWKEGELLRSLGRAPVAGSTKPVSRLHQHHVFPSDNPLPDPGGGLESGEVIPDVHDLVVNRALLLDTTNSFLQAVPPSALEERGIDLALVETHQIDKTTLGSWSDFVRARVESIRDALAGQLPRD